MIELINVCKEYGKANKQVALNNINLNINKNGFVVIYGDSGSGKTTLLNCIAKIDKPTSGVIKGITKEEISFVFQDYALFNDMSIEMNLELSRGKNETLTIDDALKKVHLDENKKKKVNELSGGQKQRVAISKALMANRNVIIADEPTGNLDSNNSVSIAEELKNFSKDKLVIVVTHNKELFEKYADRLIEIKDGCIVSDIVVNDCVETESEIIKSPQKLSFKSVFSLFKASTKLSLSKMIIGILIVFLALFSISIWLNIAFTTRYSLVKNSIDKINIPVVGFSKKDYQYMNEEDYIIAKDLNDDFITIYDYSSFGLPIIAFDDDFDLHYIYESKTYNGNVSYGKKSFNDGEVILSYYLAKTIVNQYDNDMNSLINSNIIINNKEVMVVGIDEMSNGIQKKSGYEDVNEQYLLENSYCYMNYNTYKSIIMANDLLRFNTDYSLNNAIYLNSSISDFVLDEGTDSLTKNDIVLSSNEYMRLCCTNLDKSELLNKEYKFIFKYYGGLTREYVLKIVGFGSHTMVNDETFNSLYDYSKDYYESFMTSKIGFFTNELSNSLFKRTEKKGYILDYYLSDSIESTKSFVDSISIVLAIVSIPMTLIMFLYLINFSKQNIISKKREVGILKSMSYSNGQISKIFILETVILILFSFLLTLVFVPIGITIINDIFYGSFAYYRVVNNNYVYIVILVLLMIITFAFSLYINLHKLNKKADVDLVYGR